jgi:hypothetical protein
VHYFRNLAIAHRATPFRSLEPLNRISRADDTLVLCGTGPDFVNHFRQADCGVGEGGVRFSGADLRVIPTANGCEWGGAAACGGSGNCCSLCTEEPDCKFWTFENNTCSLKTAMGDRVPTSDIDGAVSGASGTFSTHAQWTSHPQHFRDHGVSPRNKVMRRATACSD